MLTRSYIDIRDGQQLACITCALCIDACDDIMTKTGKPRGLIDYMALTDEARERSGQPKKPVWQHIIRVRTLVYTGLWSLVGILLVVALFMRSEIDLNVSPIRNPVFVTLSDGSIRNTYDLRIRNKQPVEHPFALSVSGDPDLKVSLQGTDSTTIIVPADETGSHKVFLTAPVGSASAKGTLAEIRIWVEDTVTGDRAYTNTVFHGAGQ